MLKDLNWLSATKLTKLYHKRKTSPVEVAKACLAQMAALEPKLNAMSFIDEKTTLDQAFASEKRWKKGKHCGPLDGVPLLIKDLLLTKGQPNLRGSKTVDRDQTWLEDAPSVARLREAGCVFVGRTTTPEFGWKGVTDSPLTGITRNPWDVSKTPGGSSGGSAAGLAAGYAPLALGTDGGGSIRIPAGFTGTFGLKPSFGRVAAYPLSPFGTVAHVGPMTRSVRDAALMMNELAKPDARDWHSLPYDGMDYTARLAKGVKGMKFAYSATLGYVTVDPEVAKLVRNAVRVLRAMGAKVVEIDPGFEDPGPMFRTLWWSGVRGALGGLPPEKLALVEPALQDVIEQSRSITLEHYQQATLQRGAFGARMKSFMEGYDALLTPSLPIPAFEAGKLQPADPDNHGKWVNWTPFTYPFNLTQQPAASVPCGFTKAGLPVGLQVVGRMFDDARVLRICAAYEGEVGFGKKRAV
ncbi:MAG: amidase [Alphaproteobacteria bacterium]|nr:amidase [Alphaproteobacteria bacterium]